MHLTLLLQPQYPSLEFTEGRIAGPGLLKSKLEKATMQPLAYLRVLFKLLNHLGKCLHGEHTSVTCASLLETGIGGIKSPKIRGGVKILSFQGPLKLTPVYRDSIENRHFGDQKSKSSRGSFWGESPPL